MKCFSKFIEYFKNFFILKDNSEINEDLIINETYLYTYNKEVLENTNPELDITTENLYDNI